MGVNTTRGEHGKPVYTSAVRPAPDLQAAADYAAAVGNRVIVNTYAEMTTGFLAKFGFQPWDGLECFNTDSGDITIYNAATQSWGDPSAVSTLTSGVFTASSGWTTTGGSQKLIRLGAHDGSYYFSFKRTGSTLPAGNFENVTVGRVVLPPAGGPQPLGPGYSGAANFMVDDTTGLVQLTSSVSAINNGTLISAAGRVIF